MGTHFPASPEVDKLPCLEKQLRTIDTVQLVVLARAVPVS